MAPRTLALVVAVVVAVLAVCVQDARATPHASRHHSRLAAARHAAAASPTTTTAAALVGEGSNVPSSLSPSLPLHQRVRAVVSTGGLRHRRSDDDSDPSTAHPPHAHAKHLPHPSLLSLRLEEEEEAEEAVFADCVLAATANLPSDHTQQLHHFVANLKDRLGRTLKAQLRVARVKRQWQEGSAGKARAADAIAKLTERETSLVERRDALRQSELAELNAAHSSEQAGLDASVVAKCDAATPNDWKEWAEVSTEIAAMEKQKQAFAAVKHEGQFKTTSSFVTFYHSNLVQSHKLVEAQQLSERAERMEDDLDGSISSVQARLNSLADHRTRLQALLTPPPTEDLTRYCQRALQIQKLTADPSNLQGGTEPETMPGLGEAIANTQQRLARMKARMAEMEELMRTLGSVVDTRRTELVREVKYLGSARGHAATEWNRLKSAAPSARCAMQDRGEWKHADRVGVGAE